MISVLFTNERVVYVHVKMEQVYNSLLKWKMQDPDEKNSHNLLKTKVADSYIFTGIAELVHNSDETTKSIWVFDFDGIEKLQNNAIGTLVRELKHVEKKVICNASQLADKNSLLSRGFEESTNYSYVSALGKLVTDFIKENCCISRFKYNTGEIIQNYINLKILFENNDLFFKVCYILANQIMKKYRELNSYVLFCHTMNGACVAEMLSVLLNVDVLYADRLTSKGKLRRNFMPRKFHSENKCMIVTDVVCQGHEIIRAKDIITMMGGMPSDCVGVVEIAIDGVKLEIEHKNFLITINKKMQEDIGYKIYIGE